MEVATEASLLRKEIELHHAMAIAIGDMIGTGIFVSPVGILTHVGSLGASILLWTFCGLCQMLFALCYTELACRIPVSGADYIYLKVVFGDLLGCVKLWTSVVFYVLSQSVFNGILIRYLLQAVYGECDISNYVLGLLYVVVEWFGIAVNCYSVKLVVRTQVVFTALKVILLLSIILLGIISAAHGEIGQLRTPLAETSYHPVNYALAFYSGLWSLQGWDNLCCVTGEMKHPKRDIRIALITAVSFTTVMCILASISYSIVLSKEEMLASPAVAVAFGQKIMGQFSWIMSISIVLAVLGSTIGCDLACSRIFHMGAKQGNLPNILSAVSIKRRTPTVCLIFMGMLSLLGLVSNNIILILELSGFLSIIFQALVMIAVMVLRHRDPNPGNGVVKAPFAVPEICLTIQCLLLVLTIYQRPATTCVVLLVLFLGFSTAYLLFIRLDIKPRQYFTIRSWITIIIQKTLLCVPEKHHTPVQL